MGCTRRTWLAGLGALAAVTLTGRARAAEGDGAAGMAAAAPLQAELLRTGLYLIRGGGGNALLRLSAAGAVLVNGKQAGMYKPLMSQLRRISRLSDLPVRVLMLTDAAAHHAANQALFAAAGVATLVQQSGRPLLPAAVSPAAAPVVGFDSSYQLQLGGVEVRMLHLGPVHTPADSVILFPDLRVLAVGDLCGPMPAAGADLGSAHLARWSQALARALQLDFDLVVPSQGAALQRADLQACKDGLDTLAASATAGRNG